MIQIISENNYKINEIWVLILELFLQLSLLIKQKLIKCQMCLALIFVRLDHKQDDHLQDFKQNTLGFDSSGDTSRKS